MGIKQKQLDTIVAGSVPTTVLFTCTATESVNDLVFLISDNTVSQADASSILSSLVIGYVVDKPTTTTCNVTSEGVVGGASGLTVNRKVFLSTSTPGGVVPDTSEPASPDISVAVGVAKNATEYYFTSVEVVA